MINTLKENSKKLNDKIQSFREINLALIKGISAVHGIEELNVIHKSLELANLNAWNAQMVNNSFIVTPRIEFSLTRRSVYQFLEVIDNDVRLTIKIIQGITELIVLMPELFKMLNKMDVQLSNNYSDYSDADFEREDERIEKITDSLARGLDNLKDAILWSNLYLERKQA